MSEDPRVVAEITGDASGVTAAMAEAQASVEEGTAEITGAFEAMAGTVEAALAPLAAFFAIFESFDFVKDAIDTTAEFGKQLEITGQKTGMATEALSALDYAADLSDVTVEQLNIALQRLAKNMEATEKGTGPAKDAFAALDISVVDVTGHLRPMHDVLLELATRFADMEDGAGKTALAIDIFGRSGANLIPLLNQGAQGITELEQKARELGVTMGDTGVETAGRYTDAMKEFHQVINAFERSVALAVIPTIVDWIKAGETLVRHISDIKLGIEAIFFPAVAVANVLDRIFGRKPVSEDLAKMLGMAEIPTDLLDKLGGGKTPAPIIPGKDKGPTELERWVDELNNIKQKALDNKQNLLQVELDFWKSKLALAEAGSKEYIAIHSKILSIEEEQARQADAAAKKSVEATQKLEREWEKTLEHIPQTFTTAVKNMQQTAGSFRDFMRDLWYELVAMSARAGFDMVADHYAAELAKKGITKAAAADRVLTEVEASIKTIAIKTWEGLEWIGIEAAKAAAGAWAALSSVPIIGPALGAAAAIATFAGVLALAGKLHSAVGGFDVPANMNPLTQLHAQEMVLPREYADVIRGLSGNGGGGGGGDTHNYYVTTADAASFETWAKSHGTSFYRAAVVGAQRGKQIPGMPGRGPG